MSNKDVNQVHWEERCRKAEALREDVRAAKISPEELKPIPDSAEQVPDFRHEAHIKQVLFAVRDVNQLIARESESQSLIENACENLARENGYKTAWIALTDKEGKPTRMFAGAGFDGQSSAFEKKLQNGHKPTCMCRALQNQHVVIVDDPLTECPGCPLAQNYDGEIRMARSLTYNDETYGVLTVSVSKEFSSVPEERELFEDVANDLAFAFKNNEDRMSIRHLNQMLERTEHIAKIGSWEWIIDRDEVNWSDELFRIFGLDPAQGAPTYADHHKIYSPDDFKRLNEAVQYTLKTGEPYELELRAIRSDGEIRQCIGRGYPIKDEKGKITRLYGSLQDVTKQKDDEKALFDNKQLLDMALESTEMGVWDWHIDSGKVKWAGQHARLFGILPEEFGGTIEDVQAYVHPNDHEKMLNAFNNSLKNNVPFDNTYRVVWPDGSVHWLHSFGRLIPDAQGHPERIVGITRDVTRSIQSDEYYSHIARMAREMICVADINTATFLQVNPAFERVLGYSESELLERPFLEFVHPDDVQKTLDMVDERLKQGAEVISFQNRYRCKDGSYRWLIWNSHPIAEEGKTYAIAHDITERRKVEDSLVQSREHYRLLAESTEAILWEFDVTQNKWVYVSPQAERILSYSPEEWTNLQFWEDRLHPEDREWATHYCAECTQKGEAHEFEYRFIKKDGEAVWIRDVVSVEMQGDKPVRLRGFMLDISSQKKAEQALRESEQRFRLLFENAGVGIGYFTPEGIIISFNQVALRYMGKKASELEGKSVIEVYGTRTGEEYMERINWAVQSGEDREYVDLVALSGGEKWFRSHYTPVLDHAGRTVGVQIVASNITEQKKTEEALKEERRALNEAQRVAHIGSWEYDPATGQPVWSKEMFRIFGIENAENPPAYAAHRQLIHPEDWESFDQAVLKASEEGIPYANRFRIIRPDGEIRNVFAQCKIEKDAKGKTMRLIGTTQDITDQVRAEAEKDRLEEQYRQAQKMEAIGQLTGGVAHDFNNLLQVINGSVDLAMEDIDPSHIAYESLQEVAKAGERAATLVSQLLLFSRRQIMQPKTIDLNDLIEEFLKMLRRVIGEHINLSWIPASCSVPVFADRAMLEQAVMNLCVNARDAMWNGGQLTIETSRQTVDSDFEATHSWAKGKKYAVLLVSDTGCGIPFDMQERIFEPFFTTKEAGKGTGLGLATVYGTVKQHDGMINVYSEKDKGTTFKLYLPLTEEGDATDFERDDEISRGGNETILIAEDDEMVRRLASRILHKAGYKVIGVGDGVEALSLFNEQSDQIDLVLLDVVMPGMSGKEAYDEMRKKTPELKAIFASGYSENAIHTNFVLEEGLDLVPKPYSSRLLLKKVRDALDR